MTRPPSNAAAVQWTLIGQWTPIGRWTLLGVACSAVMVGCVKPRSADVGGSPGGSSSDISLITYDEPAGPLFEGPSVDPASAPAAGEATTGGVGIGMTPLEALAPEQTAPVTIDTVLRQAVAHSTVIRDPGQFLSPGNPLLNRPEQVPSSLDPQIHAAGPFGEQAALAAFDAQSAAGVQWGRDALVQTNSFFTGNVTPANLLVSDSGTVYGRIDRATRRGGRLSLVHNWNYTPNSLATGAFNSRYVGFLRTEIREPLLAGRGERFTQIAGPASVTGGQLGRGVRVARLDQQASLDEFEAQLLRLLKQTQEAYWDLWLSHETYRLLSVSRDSAQSLLDRVRARQSVGLNGAGAADEAQAEEAVLARENAVNDALARVYTSETRLRRLVGLPAADGRALVPTEPPFEGDLLVDPAASSAAAIDSRVELRRQRNRVEALRLQEVAARSLVRPQLDLVAGAQVNGFGDEVFSGGGSGAYGSLFGGDNAGWSVGVEYSAAIGGRAARTQRRRIQLELSKALEVLSAQEEEIRHELVHAHREIERTRRGLRIADRRVAAAEKRLGVAEADAATGRQSTDLVLRAQAALAEARRGRVQSLVDYNKAIVELKRREGVLLAEHQITIADAPRL